MAAVSVSMSPPIVCVVPNWVNGLNTVVLCRSNGEGLRKKSMATQALAMQSVSYVKSPHGSQSFIKSRSMNAGAG